MPNIGGPRFSSFHLDVGAVQRMQRDGDMRFFSYLLPLVVLSMGCPSSRRSTLPDKPQRQLARVVPSGTELEVELVTLPSETSSFGQRVHARLLHGLGNGAKGAIIPEGATLEGFLTREAPTLPMRVQFESLTYAGTTMRLRATAQPWGEAERHLRLKLEEPLPLSEKTGD